MTPTDALLREIEALLRAALADPKPSTLLTRVEVRDGTLTVKKLNLRSFEERRQ